MQTVILLWKITAVLVRRPFFSYDRITDGEKRSDQEAEYCRMIIRLIRWR